MHNNCRIPAALCAALLTFAFQTALAQQAEEVIVEEVIVTATKREADVQRVPISISAYSGDFITASGVDNLEDLAPYVPNFTIATSSQPTNARLTMRGIGSTGNNAIEPAVGVFIDDVYYPRPGAVLGNLVDVASVEVLRGPQGTLFGRNTAIGALNIRTSDPGGGTDGHLEAGAGDYGAMALEGVLGAPLTGDLAGRLAARHAQRDAYGRNTFDGGGEIGGRDESSLRGKLEYDAGGSLRALLTLDYDATESGGSIVELDPATGNPAFDATQLALFGATAATADGYDYVVHQDHRDTVDDEQWGAALDLRYDVGGHSLRSISAYREWRAFTRESALRIPADVLPRITDYDTATLSQELRLLSPEGETLEYLLGLYFYEEDYGIGQDFDAGGDACFPVVLALAGAAAADACAAAAQTPAVASDFSQSLTTWATFAQTTYHASDRWSFTLGARYTMEYKDAAFEQALLNPVIGALFRAPESVPDLEADDTALTWLASGSFRATDDLMLFATVSTGFKGGGFNSEGASEPLDAEARTFAPEASTNYELGMKSRWFDDRLVANLSWYRTELEDFQDRSFDGFSFLTRNAGARTQSGVEGDLAFRPTGSLRFIGGLSYLDAEFDRFGSASPLPGDTEPQDLTGVRPHFSPRWQGSLIADWSHAIANSGLEWFLRSELQYVGEQNVGANTNANPQTVQDGYALFNLRAGVGNDRWRLTVYERNVTDEGYCQVYFDQPFGDTLGAVDAATNTSVQRCVLGEPRIYGATIRYNF